MTDYELGTSIAEHLKPGIDTPNCDMVNDPAMTVMLLECMKDSDKLVEITVSDWDWRTSKSGSPISTRASTYPSGSKDGCWQNWLIKTEAGLIKHERLGRAVAEAYAKAFGIGEPLSPAGL